MVLRLCDDVWVAIADALESPAVGHVCRRLWLLLRARHCAVRLYLRTAEASIAELQRYLPRLLTLSLQVYKNHPEQLPFLSQAPRLEALHLDVSGYYPHDGSLDVLKGLAALPRLRRLELQCGYRTFKVDVTGALLALRDMPALQHFKLDARGCHLGHPAIAALGALKDAPRLESLHLVLRDNRLGPADGAPLAAAVSAPALRALHLDVADNNLQDAAVEQVVAACAAARHLRTVALELCRNGALTGSTAALVSLSRKAQLKRLALRFWWGDPAYRDLHALHDSTRVLVELDETDEEFFEDEDSCPAGAYGI
eukprot:EG_transcript_13316